MHYLLQEITKRKRAEYRVQLAITQNPHTQKPDELWKLFEDDDMLETDDNLDREALLALKGKMSIGTGIKVK